MLPSPPFPREQRDRHPPRPKAQLLQAANPSPSSLPRVATRQRAQAAGPGNQSHRPSGLVRAGNGPPRPALGRDGGRPAAGLRPRQAPQVLLLLPLLLLLVVLPGARSRRGRRRVSAGTGAAGCDAQHHHRPPAVAVRRRLAACRVLQLLRPVLPGQHARLAVRHSYHAQGGRLEEVPPENQGLRWAGTGRRAKEPHRVRLGGDQFVGPLR